MSLSECGVRMLTVFLIVGELNAHLTNVPAIYTCPFIYKCSMYHKDFLRLSFTNTWALLAVNGASFHLPNLTTFKGLTWFEIWVESRLTTKFSVICGQLLLPTL